MKVVFLCADKERESDLADALLEGVIGAGDEGEKVYKSKGIDFSSGDAFGMVGVKSLKLFRQALDAGKQVIYFDKGYFRHRGRGRTWEYWRVAINDHHPTDYVSRARHGEARWEKISRRRCVSLPPWRGADHSGCVIYAGSSDKYHNFVGLPPPTEYATDIVAQIKKLTNRQVIYRPKPTWLDAQPVPGAVFSGREESLGMLLPRAWCLVTNGSNSSFDAVQAGVPSIVLGRGIARPISSVSLDDIDSPYLASDDERMQWLSNIAWCMFSEEEMRSGLAWASLRPQFDGEFLDDSLVKDVAGPGMKPTKAFLKRHGLWKKAWKKSGSKQYGKTRKPGLPETPV